jgi:hypothetical protein
MVKTIDWSFSGEPDNEVGIVLTGVCMAEIRAVIDFLEQFSVSFPVLPTPSTESIIKEALRDQPVKPSEPPAIEPAVCPALTTLGEFQVMRDEPKLTILVNSLSDGPHTIGDISKHIFGRTWQQADRVVGNALYRHPDFFQRAGKRENESGGRPAGLWKLVSNRPSVKPTTSAPKSSFESIKQRASESEYIIGGELLDSLAALFDMNESDFLQRCESDSEFVSDVEDHLDSSIAVTGRSLIITGGKERAAEGER